MTTRDLAPSTATSRPAGTTGPPWLLQPRNLALGGVAAIGAGLALNWGWLTAVGAAPLLLGVLPCLGMCALGLCMRGRPAGTTAAANAAEPEIPASQDSSAAPPVSPP